MEKFKYEAKIHTHPNSDKVKFIGTVKANSITELKAKAKKHAQSWNEHGGRLHLQDDNTGREWMFNS
jgi:hypothetical protein